MSTIVTRAGKGSSLTWAEGDSNFTNLNTDKYQAGDSPTFAAVVADTITADGVAITSAVDGIPLTLSDTVGSAEFDFSSGNLYFGTTSAHDLYIQVNGVSVARWDDATGTFFTAPISTNPDLDLTNGQIKFPATQVPSSNVNTLDDYEEGTWTPIDTSGASLSFSQAAGRYIKVGKLVTFWGSCTYPVTANGLSSQIGGLPYLSANTLDFFNGSAGLSADPTVEVIMVVGISTVLNPYTRTSRIPNSTLSGDIIYFSGSYEAAN